MSEEDSDYNSSASSNTKRIYRERKERKNYITKLLDKYFNPLDNHIKNITIRGSIIVGFIVLFIVILIAWIIIKIFEEK